MTKCDKLTETERYRYRNNLYWHRFKIKYNM